jgi:hypothetical protein
VRRERLRQIRKLEERAQGLRDEVVLPNGEVVQVGFLDRFEALVSLLETPEERGEAGLHPLARHIREADTGADFNEASADAFIKLALLVSRGNSDEEWM